MASTNRTGRVSSIDYEAGTYEVTYTDRSKSVTKKINAMSNGEYKMPNIGDIVSVSHNSNGTSAATTTGTVWNKTNKPAEGFKGLYRKEFGSSNGKAYERYDENEGEYKQYSNGKIKRIAAGEVYDESGGPATYSSKEMVLIISREGSVKLKAATTIEFESDGGLNITVGGCSIVVGTDGSVKITGSDKIELSAPEISIAGNAVNITGTSGEVNIGGKTLTGHTHTDSLGGTTSGPN